MNIILHLLRKAHFFEISFHWQKHPELVQNRRERQISHKLLTRTDPRIRNAPHTPEVWRRNADAPHPALGQARMDVTKPPPPCAPRCRHARAASAEMTITSRGSYDRYLGLGENGYWGEMDNHGYRKDVPFSRKMDNMPAKFDLLLSLEGGYDFTFSSQWHLRVGAYARCGLFNMAVRGGDKSVFIPYNTKWDFETFTATPVWFSDVAEGKQLHNFSVGLQLTLLYTFPQPDKCILCSQNHGKPRRR